MTCFMGNKQDYTPSARVLPFHICCTHHTYCCTRINKKKLEWEGYGLVVVMGSHQEVLVVAIVIIPWV